MLNDFLIVVFLHPAQCFGTNIEEQTTPSSAPWLTATFCFIARWR
jgi:hypothetical protein